MARSQLLLTITYTPGQGFGNDSTKTPYLVTLERIGKHPELEPGRVSFDLPNAAAAVKLADKLAADLTEGTYELVMVATRVEGAPMSYSALAPLFPSKRWALLTGYIRGRVPVSPEPV